MLQNFLTHHQYFIYIKANSKIKKIRLRGLIMEKKKFKFLRGFATRAIHSTIPKEEKSRPITSPIYQTTSFDVKDAFINQISPKYIYTRGGNPTLYELEMKLANLENGDIAETFASGMGAISSTVLSIAKKGDEVIADYELYGGTQGLFNDVLKGCGIKINYLDMTNYDAILETINDRTKLIYVESPANPTLKITDLEEDQIELELYPDKTKIYIDFAYKGIPLNLPIESIQIREKPRELDETKKPAIIKISKEDEDEEIEPSEQIQIETEEEKIPTQTTELEVSKEETVMKNISYQNFNIEIYNRPYVKFALVLAGISTSFITQRIKTLIQEFENRFNTLLTQWTGNISLFDSFRDSITEIFTD